MTISPERMLKILTIDPPLKSHNSGANWTLRSDIQVPFGNGRTQHHIEFWRKDEAMEFYKDACYFIKQYGFFEYDANNYTLIYDKHH